MANAIVSAIESAFANSGISMLVVLLTFWVKDPESKSTPFDLSASLKVAICIWITGTNFEAAETTNPDL